MANPCDERIQLCFVNIAGASHYTCTLPMATWGIRSSLFWPWWRRGQTSLYNCMMGLNIYGSQSKGGVEQEEVSSRASWGTFTSFSFQRRGAGALFFSKDLLPQPPLPPENLTVRPVTIAIHYILHTCSALIQNTLISCWYFRNRLFTYYA